MNYHNITKDDMLNGSGLRVVLWVSGCDHYCDGCHNPQTWDTASGIEFDRLAEKELFEELDKPYISGITFSGGDPLNDNNVEEVCNLCKKIKDKYGDSKTIWIYTGYTWEDILNYQPEDTWSLLNYKFLALTLCDVLVDGEFDKDLLDANYPWAGSTNQRVIDVQKSLEKGEIVLLNKKQQN